MVEFLKRRFLSLAIWALVFDIAYRAYSIFLLPKILASSFYFGSSFFMREIITSIYLIFEFASVLLWGLAFIGFAMRVIELLENRNAEK